MASLAFSAAAGVQRLTRSLVLETLGMGYITTARSKGLGEWAIYLGHALKNAFIPILTYLGMHLGYLLGGAVITETVFSIPGLGTHLINAIRMKDTPVVTASVVFLSIFFSVVMLLVDILTVCFDSRLRKNPGRGK
jgi:peptide/nickel transport system permease protein